MTEDEQKKAKEVEFYSAMVDAWINSSFEHDRSLMTLSAGGIGLLITLITTIGVTSSEALVLHILAILSFLTCLLTLLLVFRKNKSHIENVLSGNAGADPNLAFLDKLALLSFVAGVSLAVIIGISAAVTSFHSHEENPMSKDKITYKALDSIVGIENLDHKVILKKSLEGVGSLKPESKPRELSINNVGVLQGTQQTSQGQTPTSTPTTPDNKSGK